MRSDRGTANLHLSTHCLCRQHTSALKLPSLSACHPILRRHQNSALALALMREQEAAAQSLSKLGQLFLSHPPNWADFSYYFSVAVSVPGQVGPAFRSHPPGARESWSWSIWMKREESENNGIFYLPAISSKCIPFQCRKSHLINFNILCFVFCAEIFSELPPEFPQTWLQDLKNIWWNLTRVNLVQL